MAIQCGEPGPFAQIIGAVDQALWDMAAHRAGVPLWRFLGGRSGRVRVYASGIGPDKVVEVAQAKWAQGYRAFKLKVGFDAERDRANLAAMRQALGEEAVIMCDANQAWSPEQAAERIAQLAPYRPYWIEEPIGADQPHEAWSELARSSAIPLAAGENLRGQGAFAQAIDAGYLRFVQPDVGKWGGIGGGLAVARLAHARGMAYCPHWLAGGVGLAASMHALAASGPRSTPTPTRCVKRCLRRPWSTAGSACQRRPVWASSPTCKPCPPTRSTFRGSQLQGASARPALGSADSAHKEEVAQGLVVGGRHLLVAN
jgi:L-alanine-DL-glutamate epimerase-like enolase superfamily enzyme